MNDLYDGWSKQRALIKENIKKCKDAAVRKTWEQRLATLDKQYETKLSKLDNEITAKILPKK